MGSGAAKGRSLTRVLAPSGVGEFHQAVGVGRGVRGRAGFFRNQNFAKSRHPPAPGTLLKEGPRFSPNQKFVFLTHPTPTNLPHEVERLQKRGVVYMGWGGSEKQTFISTKSKSLFSPSWSSCCPGSLLEQDDRTSRTEKTTFFFFGEIPGTSLSSAEVPAVPGFYKVLVFAAGGASNLRMCRRRSDPRVSSDIELGVPPYLQVHQPSCLPAVSSATRRLRASSVGLPRIYSKSTFDFQVGRRRGSFEH